MLTIKKMKHSLRMRKPSQDWPQKSETDITDTDKVGTLSHMQFIVWRERCARCFADSNKNTDELLEEILWQLKYFEKSHVN